MTPTEPLQGSGESEEQGPQPASTASSAGAANGASGRGRGRSRRGGRRGWIVVGLLAVVVVVAGVVLAILVANSDDSGHPTATVSFSDDFASTAVEPLAGRALTGATAASAHEAPSWSTPVGSFVVLDGTTTGGPTSTSATPSLGVVQATGTVVKVSGRLDPAQPGLGFVFRYRDPKNYWSLVPLPRYATWNVYVTMNGRSVFKGNTGYSSFDKAPVEIVLDGETIRVSIAGAKAKKLTSPVFAEAQGAGLIALTNASSPGRCTEFAVTEER